MYRWRRRRCRPTTRRPAATLPVPRCRHRRGEGDTDRRRSTSSTTGPPAHSTCSAGTLAARTWRWASARTCHICQVDRRCLHRGQTCPAVCATQGASAIVAASAGGASAVCTIDATASSPPSTAAASSSQVARCSARERGSCLASRVSRVACWARCIASTGVGGRPWSAWNCGGELAAAGLDVGPAGGPALVQSRVDADDLPDRPLRRVGAGPLREPHAERVAEVLLQGGVVGLRGGDVGLEQHPAVDGQPRPSRVCTLFATATWVCRSGSPARESRWVNAAATRPRTSTCRTPCGAVPGVQGVLLDERQRVLRPRRGGPARSARRPRAATAHRVDTDLTGENVRSYPATALVRGRECLAMVPGQLAGVGRVPAVLGAEELAWRPRCGSGPAPRP